MRTKKNVRTAATTARAELRRTITVAIAEAQKRGYTKPMDLGYAVIAALESRGYTTKKATKVAVDQSVVVGTPATYHIGSDRYPYTVIKVSASGKSAVIQADTMTRTSGSFMTGDYQGLASRDPDGRTMKVTLRGDGSWRAVGGKAPISMGRRDYYQDPHF